MKKEKSNIIPFPKKTWKTVDSNSLSEGDVIFQNGNTRVILSSSYDYSNCYYEGDIPDINITTETQILS